MAELDAASTQSLRSARQHLASGVLPLRKESEMARIHHVSTTAALLVCLVGSPLGGTLFASEEEPSSSEAPSSQSMSNTSSPPPTLVHSPFRLTDERLTADAPIGAASSQA